MLVLLPRTAAASGITVRRATAADEASIAYIAALDSSAAPRGEVLVADVGGEIVAARSLTKPRGIADPFRQTADISELLELRARQAA